MERTIELPLQTRLSQFGNIDINARTADVVWTTGAKVPQVDWVTGERFLEQLSLDPAHVRMGRLQSGAPLLDTHKRYSLAGVLGVVERATLDATEGRAKVRFSERAEVQPFFKDVADKIIRNVSVGYVVHKYERSTDAATGMPLMFAIDYEPAELSLVPVGADAGAGVRSDEQRKFTCTIINKETTMPDQIDTATQLETVKPSAAELHRFRTIHELCERNQLDAEFERELIGDGVTLKEARTRVTAKLAERTEATEIRSGVDIYGAVAGDLRTRMDMMIEAQHARYGGPKPSEQARQFVGARLSKLAGEILQARGFSIFGMSEAQLIERALHATSDFSDLLTGTGNRSLRMAYESYKGGLARICRQSTAVDFRAKQKLALGTAPTLLKVLEGGEFTRGTMAKSKESYSLSTYGRIFGISRTALVNDDLGAFMDLTRAFGIAAAEFVAQELVTLLTSNPTMGDSVALFHATHANLSGSSDAIAVASLGAAKEAMRLQKGIGGVVSIDVTPRFLAVPAKKETLAQQYVAQLTAAVSSNVNPFAGQLEVVVDPRLDAVSTTAWYLAADPAAIDTIEYSYLEGAEGPQLFVRNGFDVDGVETKCVVDFGAGVLDFRGLFKNPGA